VPAHRLSQKLRHLTKTVALSVPPVGRLLLEKDRLRRVQASLELSLARAALASDQLSERCRQLEDQLDCGRGSSPSQLPSAPESQSISSPKSLVFSSLPKSGTEFFWGGLRDATGAAAPPLLGNTAFMAEYLSGYYVADEVISTGVFTSERLLPKQLARQLSAGRYVIGAHAPASYHNLRALGEAGVRRIAILIRDPRDATVSWTHHLRSLGATMRNFNSLAMHIPGEYYNWPHAKQLEYQIRTFMPAAVNWIESWLEAPLLAPELEIHYVAFEELSRDPVSMFSRVLTFYGCDDHDLSMIKPAQSGVRHFRKGKSGQWRDEFSASDKAFAENLIGDRLRGMHSEAT
jgi:hypothetical protein